jgi:hypothetical protein
MPRQLYLQVRRKGKRCARIVMGRAVIVASRLVLIIPTYWGRMNEWSPEGGTTGSE